MPIFPPLIDRDARVARSVVVTEAAQCPPACVIGGKPLVDELPDAHVEVERELVIHVARRVRTEQPPESPPRRHFVPGLAGASSAVNTAAA